MKALIAVLLVLLAGACASTPAVPLVPGATEKVAHLEKQIAILERRIELQEQQVSSLTEQLAAARAREAALQQEIDALNERVAALNTALQEARQAGTTAAQFEALNRSLRQNRALLERTREQVATAERSLSSTQAENRELLQELDDVYGELARREGPTAAPSVSVPDPVAAGTTEPQPIPPSPSPAPELQPPSSTSSASDDLYVSVDDDGSLKMELFYGTNRLPLEPSKGRYFTPFIIPLLLLALLILVPRLIRYLFRDRLHRVSINLVRVVFIVALVYFLPAALQKARLRWQADHSLLVQYGPQRQIEVENGERYSVGTCIVSIPPVHVSGNVELPDLMHFEFSADPRKHFVLEEVNPLATEEYFEKLKARVTSSREQTLFVFVHGFHNTFQDAAFRTAQIAHDMNFPGVPVFFSWPSQGKVLDYTTDENNVGEAASHLTDFLDKLRTESGATRIHVIAHSMGSRALTAAVKDIGSRHDGPVFNEMILAAPDIDAGLFRNLAPELVSATDRVTLYASSKDQALTASRQVHGGDYPRAGESLPTPVVVLPVESIDVSAVSGGHSYIADSGRILDDLNNILLYRRELNTDIAEEHLDRNGYTYWKLK